jgi:flagellar hook-associated protein 1 FlgK
MNISLSGLNAAMSGIRTVQQNIANVNTEGYHRQQSVFTASTPQFSGGGYLGTGVNIDTVRRIYDQFLDSQTRNYQSQLSGGEAYAAYATEVDALLGSDATGLRNSLQTFFASLNQVVNDPTSAVARQQVLSAGNSLAARFNQLSGNLDSINTAINTDVENIAAQINSYADRIQALNSQISRGIGSGQTPNDLLDQREQLVAQLGKLVNVSQIDQSDGSVVVLLGHGQPLVVGSSVRHVQAVNDPIDPTQKTLAIEIPNSAATETINTGDITGGRLGGLFSFRDDVLNPTMTDLDAMAQSLADAFNTQHALGEDLDGNAGANFFNYSALDPAGTLAVAITQPSDIAAAAAGTGPGDNSNAVDLADIADLPMAGLGGVTLNSYNAAMIGRNATYANAADSNVTNFTALYKQSYDALQSLSGVNLDEEAINLIQYQQAYQAAAKAIQASSTLFDAILGAVR